MVGHDASKLRSMLEVNYPMENGIVRYVMELLQILMYTIQICLLN